MIHNLLKIVENSNVKKRNVLLCGHIMLVSLFWLDTPSIICETLFGSILHCFLTKKTAHLNGWNINRLCWYRINAYIKLETIVELQFKQQSRAQVFFHINIYILYLFIEMFSVFNLFNIWMRAHACIN